MSRGSQFDAIIVGAGPVGAALALALARDGCSVALIESAPPVRWSTGDPVDPRVVALADDAINLLDRLDVWQSIMAARCSPYRRMHVWDAEAPGELVWDAAERGTAALGAIVETRLIQHVLWQALQAQVDNAGGRSVRLLSPARVVSFDQDDAQACIELDDGTTLRARLLVAADGAASSLRERAGIGTSGHGYGQRAVVAHVATTRPHEGTAWQRFLPGGPLAFLPLADGRSSVVWSLPEAEANRILALDDDAFLAELGCALDMRLGPVTATTPRLAFPLRLKLAERYVAGRCVLAGDAAHAVHPLAGQGMNLGLRDVICLHRVIAAARARAGDIGAPPVLRRYERERRSENTLGALGFDVIHHGFAASRRLPAWLRGAALGAAGSVGPLRRWLADMAAGRA